MTTLNLLHKSLHYVYFAAMFVHVRRSANKAVRRVAPSRLRRARNLDNITALATEITRHWVAHVHARQLALFHTIACEHGLLLCLSQQLMLRHQSMFGDVHQQLLFLKDLKNDIGRHALDLSARWWRHVAIQYDNAPLFDEEESGLESHRKLT